jgi:RNA polymerase sigma factor (sigma-70 family)
MSYNSSQEDRDDCFQEVLRVLIEEDYKRLKQIRSHDEKAFRAYLGVLTKRRTLNFVRGIKESYSLPDEILNIIPDSNTLPDVEILRHQIIDIINQKLTDQERLVMFYILEGLTLEEISELMDLKLGTVFIFR